MAIDKVEPVIIPAREEKTYPKLWLSEFVTQATDTFDSVRVATKLKPYKEAGGLELAPNVPPLEWADGNVFTLHARCPDLDAVVGAVLDNFAAIRAAAPSHTLALLELLAQAVGAVAQAPVVDEQPLE